MSRKDKGEKIGGQWIPLLTDTMKSKAWLTMSASARVLYIALKSHHFPKNRNNGRIYLSVRKAAEETGLNMKTVARGFHELVHYGFIAMTQPGCLGFEGRGKAPHWRLTELSYMTDPPTKDFRQWDGVIFRHGKNPVPKNGTACTVKGYIQLYPKTEQLDRQLYPKTVHTDAQPCTVKGYIARSTTPKLKEEDGREPEWSAPSVEEVLGKRAEEILRAIAGQEALDKIGT